MINKREYPISVLQDVELFIKHFQNIKFKYLQYIEVRINENVLLHCFDKQKKSFSFIIDKPGQDTNTKKTSFYAKKSPSTAHSMGESGQHGSKEDIYMIFENWLSLIIQYNTISLSQEEEFIKQEEKEFYNEFELGDNDELNMQVLPLEGQRKLYKLLEHLEHSLASEPISEITTELVKDAQQLKEDIDKLPKGVLAKKVAHLIIKVKKHGLKFFFDVVDVVYKEAIKLALRGGAEAIHHIVQN